MEHGQVRTILLRHVQPQDVGAPAADPNVLVPASRMRRALEGRDEAVQRALAADYVALWARTFRTLVGQLRGRPERALALFVGEVYPFLRDDRLAARLDATHAQTARVTLVAGLPDAYNAGLLQAFVNLSGARAHVQARGGDAYDVSWATPAADRLARVAQTLAGLRLHLIFAGVLSAALGLALARADGAFAAWRAVAAIIGVVAAQVGANAVHDLRHRHPAGPLGPQRLSRLSLKALALGGFSLAAALAGVLAVDAPFTILFAAAGMLAALLFGPARSAGLGPLLAAAVYGPLVAEGALHAAGGSLHHVEHLIAVLPTLPLGFAAGALLYLDDLADRPLDEAGGQRTLAVRLPRRRQLLVYAGFLLAASLSLAALAILGNSGRMSPYLLTGLLLALATVLLVRSVGRHLADPSSLGRARLGTIAAMAVAALVPILNLLVNA